MKKVFLVLCIILTLVLTACGSSDEDKKSESASASKSSESGSPTKEPSKKDDDKATNKDNTNKDSEKATKILGKKCAMVNIAPEKKNKTKNSCEFDIDLDGKKEKISIEIASNKDDVESVYLAIDNQKKKLEYLDNISLNINAFTLDGNNIYLIVNGSYGGANLTYDFFSYKDKKIVPQGSIIPDVNDKQKIFSNHPLVFKKDGTIFTSVRSDVIQTDPIEVTLKPDKTGAIKIVEQGTYNFTQNNNIKLLKQIAVSDKVGKKATKKIKPQNIKIKKVTCTKVDFASSKFDDSKHLNDCYVYIEASDGTKGWLQCSKKITDSKYADSKSNMYFDNIIIYG